jgi:hypothetical protein
MPARTAAGSTATVDAGSRRRALARAAARDLLVFRLTAIAIPIGIYSPVLFSTVEATRSPDATPCGRGARWLADLLTVRRGLCGRGSVLTAAASGLPEPAGSGVDATAAGSGSSVWVSGRCAPSTHPHWHEWT